MPYFSTILLLIAPSIQRENGEITLILMGWGGNELRRNLYRGKDLKLIEK